MVLFRSSRKGSIGPFPLTSLFLSLFTVFDPTNAISSISATGAKLFDSDGNQFRVKGAFYSVDSDDDVLATTEQCKTDIELMKELGINTVRVRNIESSSGSEHDGCMNAFADAGIYLVISLHTDSTGVNPDDPQWNEYMFNSMASKIDTFAKYDNVLTFVLDNVKTSAAGPASGPYIKAAVHDMKAYRDSKGYRNFPIGYIEGVDSDTSLGEYLTCGEEAVDLYGMNGDSFCSSSSDARDSLNDFAIDGSEFNVPIIEGNVGCADTDIILEHQTVIHDTSVSDVISGGLMFTWVDFDDSGNSHLTEFPGDDLNDKPVKPKKNNPFFSDMQKIWKESEPSTVTKSNYSAPTAPASCPSSNGDWAAALKRPLPTLADTLISTASPTSTDTAKNGAAVEEGQKEDSDSGLSTGAKVAVGVVVPVVFIIVAAVFFFLYRRRKQQQRQREQELAAMGSDLPKKDHPAPVQGFYEKEQPDQIPPRPELGDNNGQQAPRELAGASFVGELEDTSLPTEGRRGS